MRPLLAHIYEPKRVTYPCYVQPKLNGIRALYQGGRFQSRDELPFPVDLLDHLAKPLLEIFGPEVILDGELYKHGWPLQRINAAVTPVRQELTEDTLQVEYHVFDVVDKNKSFGQRFKTVWFDITVSKSNVIHAVKTSIAETEQGADLFYVDCVEKGYEGMMYRLGDCPYTTPKQNRYGYFGNPGYDIRSKFLSDKDNRAFHLLKRKDWQDDEFEIIGVVEGEGKYVGMMGAIICQTNGSKFNVGSGFSDAERTHYFQNPPIGKLCKVKYLVLSSDGIPLNPTNFCIL